MTATLSEPPPASAPMGWLVETHVAKSAAWLDERLLAQPALEMASTFVSLQEAELAITTAITHNAEAIAAWVSEGARGSVPFEAPFEGGLVRLLGGYSAQGTAVRVLLRGDGCGGFFVVTGHPLPWRVRDGA